MSTATDVRERPILFSGEMVRAILEGHKVQTRRVVRTPMAFRAFYEHQEKDPRSLHDAAIRARIDPDTGDAWFLVSGDHGWYGPVRCPYGRPGDRLWVRETWASDDGVTAWYCADGETYNAGLPWKPSIHMPRWASRITLEVTSVRVERVQEISEEDALDEGVEAVHSAREGFSRLWDSINAKRGFGWDENPWCWCISFRRAD